MKISSTLALALGLFCVQAAAQPNLLNGVAVIVNDAVITYKDVYTRLAPNEETLERRFATQPKVLEQKKKELMQETLEELVVAQLILHEFKTAGYNLPESYIEDKIKQTIRSYGDRLTLTKTLQAEGMTFEAFRTKTRERFILDAMWFHNVPQDPVISPTRIENYYNEHRDDFKMGDQVKLRMIVLPNRPSDPSFSPKKLAQEVVAKLKEGVPFADLARIYSQGSQAAQGGDWGWVERKVLREELADKAFSLKAGEISDVVETPEACYVMLVEELRLSHVRPLTEVRDEIETALKDQEKNKARKKYIEKLKSKSFIRYF